MLILSKGFRINHSWHIARDIQVLAIIIIISSSSSPGFFNTQLNKTILREDCVKDLESIYSSKYSKLCLVNQTRSTESWNFESCIDNACCFSQGNQHTKVLFLAYVMV